MSSVSEQLREAKKNESQKKLFKKEKFIQQLENLSSAELSKELIYNQHISNELLKRVWSDINVIKWIIIILLGISILAGVILGFDR